MVRRRLAFYRFGLALAAASACVPALGLDLPTLIGSTDTASSATVYLVPPMAVFTTTLDEGHMQLSACRYTTSDPASVRALVALLAGAGVAGTPLYQRPDVREGVYLTLTDGSQLKFLLQDNNGSRLPVIGVAENSTSGSSTRVSVTARRDLALDLRKWAEMRGGSGTGSSCDRQSAVRQGIAP